jgi:hypothetical protein
MHWNRFVFLLVLWASGARGAYTAECSSSPAKEIDLDLWSTRSLPSPDRHWQFVSIGPNSSDRTATLYIQNPRSSQKWNIGSIERNGTAFWSEDSKRLFLRDEYAVDDTKIRVFDVTSSVPKEIEGLDDKIQKALFAYIPINKTTQWLYYPKVCFAANDSSTIMLVADAPLVPETGSGSGKPFSLKLTVNLITLKVMDSVPGTPQESGGKSLNAVTAPASWYKLDAGPFSILAPSGWEFHQLTGVDSYVGEFVGDGLALTFDFGRYSNSLKEAKSPAYIINRESIGGFHAKVVSPRAPGHGVTGVYFRDVGHSNRFCLWGRELTAAQQELVLKIFETIRLGGPTPRYLTPPPPPSKNAQ